MKKQLEVYELYGEVHGDEYYGKEESMVRATNIELLCLLVRQIDICGADHITGLIFLLNSFFLESTNGI